MSCILFLLLHVTTGSYAAYQGATRRGSFALMAALCLIPVLFGVDERVVSLPCSEADPSELLLLAALTLRVVFRVVLAGFTDRGVRGGTEVLAVSYTVIGASVDESADDISELKSASLTG